jgi:tRNA uridine 5-carboxymethylaminomethyl modification enzyme
VGAVDIQEDSKTNPLSAEYLMAVAMETKYAGYIDQRRRQIERMSGSGARVIPGTIVFGSIPGVSRKVGERLTRVRPATLGAGDSDPGGSLRRRRLDCFT